MRRKSERTATKKTKASPEKKEKPDKGKRTKTRRRKQSTSSDHESADETKPVPPPVPETVAESNPPQTSAKEAGSEETNDQVWQVKAAEGETGEIQKLKICLTRPPSTPERADRSPRSKRKHSRSASGEPTEDRKKSKHRSKRSTAETKDGSDKNRDSQGDEPENDNDQEEKATDESESSQKQEVSSNETPMSTTTDENKPSENTKSNEGANTSTDQSTNKESQNTEKKSESEDKPSDADTTVASPKSETEESQSSLSEKDESSRKRSISGDKSEILEIHADESRFESSDIRMNESQTEEARSKSPRPDSPRPSKEDNIKSEKSKVGITDDTIESIHSENNSSAGDKLVSTNKSNVVESSKSPEKEIVRSISNETEKQTDGKKDSKVTTPEPAPVSQERTVHNGQTTTHSRKRRWGSRPSRITTQKSITISTDVLKDIIPDVKPAEFDEVIEEKKYHRRVEVTEKLERPVLPKIVIDNTESVEINKKENDDRDKENIKIRETNLSSNRKISIVKDSDSIITRPPSPPRHKQSSILYITNLVRPFTLPQLKNLLQRTGRIVDNGFWIDRIKSKCYVQYETEDQAVETRHALHGVTWPVSNPKTLHVDFSTKDDFDKAKANEDTDNAQVSTIPGTVEDWLREQDLKRERGELEKPWERKMAMREWDVGKNEKGKEKDKLIRDERLPDKRRHRTPERSPEPARKFKKKEEEAPAKLLDDLFRKTKATPCIYWLPLSAETIAVKEEQRRQHMAEHERRLQELRRTHRRH